MFIGPNIFPSMQKSLSKTQYVDNRIENIRRMGPHIRSFLPWQFTHHPNNTINHESGDSPVHENIRFCRESLCFRFLKHNKI
jgi:hypothetical protein